MNQPSPTQDPSTDGPGPSTAVNFSQSIIHEHVRDSLDDAESQQIIQ